MEIIFANTTHLSEISILANKIWHLSYASILSENQINFMLKEMYSLNSLLEQIENNHIFKIALVDNKIIGFGSFQKLDNSEVYKIHKLYVDKTSKIEKVGSKLLIDMEVEIKNLGGLEIILNVNRNNSAVNFYKKMGYQIIRNMDIPFGDFILNDFIMQKSI